MALYNSGANYSYSITPSAGSPVQSTQTTRYGMAPSVDSSYIPPGQRMANFGNVFNPANANAMDYSLYTDYYSTTPQKPLGQMVAEAQGSQYQPRGYTGQGSLGPSQTRAGHSVSSGQADQSFLQNYDQNLSNIQQGIAGGTMAWGQTPEQVAAGREAARQAALQNPWWGDASGQIYNQVPSPPQLDDMRSRLQLYPNQIAQQQSRVQDLFSTINQTSDHDARQRYINQWRDAVNSLNQMQNDYTSLQHQIDVWSNWWNTTGQYTP